MNDGGLILTGTNIFLRKVRLADVNENYHRWMNDTEVNRYMETRFRPQSMEDIKAYVQKMNEDPNVLFLAIIYKDEKSHIGNIKLGPISEIHKRAEISFFLGEQKVWGKGLATETVCLMTDYGINEMGLIKITGGCYSNNIGSIRVFEKSGYVLEGVLQTHYFCEGKMVDRLCYAKVNNIETSVSF